MDIIIHNTVIRDNIHGARLIPVTDTVRHALDTREIQRLRNIRQTGLASLVFPGAEHSRFSHTLGAYATAFRAFQHLKTRSAPYEIQIPGLAFDAELETEFMLAVLCHDIGHTAYSHVLERTLLPNGLKEHESCALHVLDNDHLDITTVIRESADIDAVKAILTKTHPNKVVNDLISSTFDVDRCDYVLRDSAMTGVRYGRYDLQWLIHSMLVDINDIGQPILVLDGPRGLDALRQFLSARRYLYKHVYYHPAVRGAQLLLKSIFHRLQDIGSDGQVRSLIPACLKSILDTHSTISITDFLQTTDIQINYMIHTLAMNSTDTVLKLLCSMFRDRNLLSCVLDTGKWKGPATNIIVNEANPNLFAQQTIDLNKLKAELIDFIAGKMAATGMPEQAARYLVGFDKAEFRSSPARDMFFRFGTEVVPIESIDAHELGFDLHSLTEPFSLTRVFAPRIFKDSVREYISDAYPIILKTNLL